MRASDESVLPSDSAGRLADRRGGAEIQPPAHPARPKHVKLIDPAKVWESFTEEACLCERVGAHLGKRD